MHPISIRIMELCEKFISRRKVMPNHVIVGRSEYAELLELMKLYERGTEKPLMFQTLLILRLDEDNYLGVGCH